MTPLEMITEWERGCSCCEGEHPITCSECTLALINALKSSLSTESKEEGTRYRLERIAVKTTWNYAGQVDQLVESPTGLMQRRVLNTMERQSRDALIALGWTPPRK